MVGGRFGATTDTVAVPARAPLCAVTVLGPPALVPAVKRPPPLMVPPPLTLHANEGWVAKVAPNWSRAVALNCWAAEMLTVALAGETAMLAIVGLTTTVTALVTVWLAWSLMATWKL